MSWRRCRKGLVRDDRVSSRLWPIRLGGRIRWWWPPLAAWGAAAGVVTLTCTLEGWRPFAASRTWVRWDSGLYLSVAEHGYHLFRCRSLVYGRGNWCGNAGWFPAYPWLLRGLHLLDVPFAQAGLAISWLAGAVMLVVVWRGFGRRRTLGQAAVVVGYAAFAPGLVYDFALFPLSLLSLCAVTAFALADRGRWLPAGLAAAAAALAYPLGVAVIPAAAIWSLMQRSEPLAGRIRRLGLLAGPPLAALALFGLDQQLETGHWDAYLLVQHKYDHSLEDPLAPVFAAAGTIVHGSAVKLAPGPPVHTLAPALQTLLVALVLASVLASLVLGRGALRSADALVALYALTAWIATTVVANVSIYRGEAALLPLALLTRRLPLVVAAGLTLAALLLVAPMTRLYLRGLLV